MRRHDLAITGLLLAALLLPGMAAEGQPRRPERPSAPTEPAVPEAPATPSPQVGPDLPERDRRASDPYFERTSWRRMAMRVGGRYTLRPDEAVREVVVIAADAVIEGLVDGDVVVVFGNAQLSSTAVIGGSFIVVGGDAHVMPGARVRRDVSVVGGRFNAPAEFAAGGDHFVLDPAAFDGWFARLVDWVTHGLLWGRLIIPSQGWVWGFVAVFFILYLICSLTFEGPVRATAEVLSEKPLSAFVVGLLALLLTGPLCMLLAVSVVGIPVVPFVLCALLVAWIVGKIGTARWLGRRLVAEDAPEQRLQATRSFVIGFALICAAYMLPVLGLVTWAMVGVLGLGSSMLAFLAAYRREQPLPARVAPPAAVAAPSGAIVMNSTDFGAVPLAADVPSTSGTTADATSFPSAPFRDRLAAGVLDVILVVIIAQMLDPITRDEAVFLLLLGYFVGFWAWKGTTVGGIICQLRVVRVDGTPLRFVDALVRGLSSVFSAVVIGLGFLWILKDPERQAWHDKIAGTYVVKVPRNWPI